MARKSSTMDQLVVSYQQQFNALSKRMQRHKTRNKYEVLTYKKARRKLFTKSFPKTKTYHQLHFLSN